MANAQRIGRVQKALNGLRLAVEEEYLRCAIHSEADVQAVVIQHLKQELRQDDDHWIIGANHGIDEYRPDVLCYYAPLRYGAFVNDFLGDDVSLIAAIEIKWASSLKEDLDKLQHLQKEHRKYHRKDILAWMVYGGHFDPYIHKANAAEDERREEAIKHWANKFGFRGQTVIRCGEELTRGASGKHAERLRAMSNRWWHNDREARSRNACS
jgi:hypothetical protein